MRFEDYLYNETYINYSNSNAHRRKKSWRSLTREQRHEKSKQKMIIITFVCLIILFLALTVGSCSANYDNEQIDVPIQAPIQEPIQEPVEEIEEDPVEEIVLSETTVVEEVEILDEAITPVEDIIMEESKVEYSANPYDSLLEGANRIDNVKITHYCAEKYHHICNAGSPYKTARGNEVIPDYTCAVDPRVIPLGSLVFVDFGDGVIHGYIADDTGGAIKGNRVDLAVATHQYAKECGVKTATVWWIKE